MAGISPAVFTYMRDHIYLYEGNNFNPLAGIINLKYIKLMRSVEKLSLQCYPSL